MIAPTNRRPDPSMPIDAPSAAIAKPTMVNEPTSPAASASGPNRWRCAALPRTIGTSGSTHGDRIVSAPAAYARTGLNVDMAVLAQRRRGQCTDRVALGNPGGARGFPGALEGDQRALHPHAQRPFLRRLTVKVQL